MSFHSRRLVSSATRAALAREGLVARLDEMLAELELLHDDPTPTRDWLQFRDEQNADIGAPPSGEKPR